MNQDLLNSIIRQLSLGNLLIAAIALSAAWLSGIILRLASRRLSERFSLRRIGIQQGFLLGRVAVWAIALAYVVFGILEPSANVLMGLAASVGLAVGLASQDMLKNFITWLIVVITRPFRLGDLLRLENDYGEIIAITPNLTRLRTFDDNQVTFPTAWLLSKKASNANAGSLREMVVVEFRVPAHLDPQRLRQIAWDAAAGSPYTCLSRPITALVGDGFDRTFLTRLTLKCYVLDVRLERIQMSHLAQLIKRELTKSNLLTPESVAGLLANCAPAESAGKAPK